MEQLTYEAVQAEPAVNAENDAQQPYTMPDEKTIMDLAKRRWAIKRNLIGQIVDFCMIGFLLFLLIAAYDRGIQVTLSFFFCLFWGTRLAFRIIKFAKPSFKNGIGAYFQERKARKIESEYNRLKQKGPEFVAIELNR